MGHSAFAHKGGVHVSAVLKDAATYEHVSPKTIGNRQRVLLSDLSGRGSILYKLKQHGLEDRLDDTARRELLDRIKQMEFQGYELEAAEGTFELMVREALNPGLQLFEVVELRSDDQSPNGSHRHGDAEGSGRTCTRRRASGNGPVHALDQCLRKCLSKLYPAIAKVRLTDYKVRVLDAKKGTAARVRVLVEWSDHRRSWTTVGVSENVIEASWFALVDALRLEIMRLSATRSDHRARRRRLLLGGVRKKESVFRSQNSAIHQVMTKSHRKSWHVRLAENIRRVFSNPMRIRTILMLWSVHPKSRVHLCGARR